MASQHSLELASHQGPDTPLHGAATRNDAAAIKRFLAEGNGWAINARDPLGMSPLHCAVLGGCLEAVSALLELGADPNLIDHFGVPPLWTAEDDFGLDDIAARLRHFGATKG
jgi:ankyrin repeat protein